MIIKCQKCGGEFEPKDVFDSFHPLCRECIIEEDHDCKGEKCEVCNFVNSDKPEYEPEEIDKVEDMNEETRKVEDYNPETHKSEYEPGA